ncbi:hypothetical protein CY34DRAFT_515767 [Suillus luteus UH-Slu-Lm8-n1]|uniref:Unplaced genomic scaffold CY34scaffold_4, whole genome shotgun sequence n=1 Tax=Suillus luteus UH-Slu-Lm8-n1 TaxID=930992 RepID=A0A0D0BGV8_9AGAM|nr:hypothetical protein CY34DRAFT_515767 [Suillus luteus UH-Slu-Lm8-n1]
MSSDSCNPPPPSYELSQQGHDRKIVEKKIQELLLSKIPIHAVEEERDEDDSKDSKEPEEQKQKQPSSLFQTPVQPLHIQKRTLRGARPLPPSPADAHYSRSKPAAIHPIGSLKEEPEHHDYQEVLSPPPPFTPVGPSLEGPPYEYSMYCASGSASQHPPNRSSFDPSPVRRGQHRPSSSYSPAEPRTETSYRRVSHGSYLEPSCSKHSTPPRKSSNTRLNFNPSVAYATSSNPVYDPWEHASNSTAVDAASLYSSAVSSYLHPGSAVNPASYVFSTPPRPSASYESLTPASNPGSPALQFHSPYGPAYSASQQSLPRYAQSKSNQGGHVRWASEADLKDRYP